MPIIESVNFSNSNRRLKKVDLLHPNRPKTKLFETTLITGQNGSHKSTLLKQLVTSLVLPKSRDLFDAKEGTDLNPEGHQIFCLSGSAADRFPPKELSQGRRSPYDVPYYTYIGQRVGNNLLSRKAPLENMLSSALHPRASERCSWNFFSEAHRHAGILPASRYTVVFRSGSRNDKRPALENLRVSLAAITPEDDGEKYNRRPVIANVSYATAQSLLSEFTETEFDSLARILARSFRFDVVLTSRGVICADVSPIVLRLGLLLDLVRLQDVQVRSEKYETEFSAFELSSGEYHMFSTILAIGFGIEEKSVLLMDEPENSLHPQWQRELMSTVFSTCSQVMQDGHVIVSTHSPLIVGSASEGSTVVDMTLDEPQLTLVSYGASADELLLNQFGVASSRNKVVVDKVQLAVSLIERGDFENPEFKQIIPELLIIRNSLTSTDPLVDVINALLIES